MNAVILAMDGAAMVIDDYTFVVDRHPFVIAALTLAMHKATYKCSVQITSIASLKPEATQEVLYYEDR